MTNHTLDFNTKKALCVHLGDPAGNQLANLILKMAERIEKLERDKVVITPVAPANSRPIT